MPKNQIKVICKNGVINKTLLWDSDGTKYNATSVTNELVGLNPSDSCCFRLHANGNNISNDLQFESSKKVMILDVEAPVIAKFISMGAKADSSPDDD